MDAVVHKNQRVCSKCQKMEAAFASFEGSHTVDRKVRRRVIPRDFSYQFFRVNKFFTKLLLFLYSISM